MDKVEVVDVQTKEDLVKLGSAITWEGFPKDEKNPNELDQECLNKLFDHLATKCKVNKKRVYRTTGKQWVNWFNLTGDNAYMPDINIISISFKDCDTTPFIPVQFTLRGRWLDDIISNNEMRESRKAAF